MNKRCMLLALSLAVIPSAAIAVDGTKLIDQARALAGSLTPGDTPGFPVTISVAGSYRLSGNLTVPNEDTTAIEITADNVTLDLNGFAILGPVRCTGSPLACTASGDGVGVLSQANYTSVRNGGIRGMGNDGIRMTGAGALATAGHLVMDLQVQENVRYGIRIGRGTIRNSVVESNGLHGIDIDDGIAAGNTARANRGSGIRVDRATVTGNLSALNETCGISIEIGLVSGNTTSSNTFAELCTTFGVGSRVGYLGNVFTNASSDFVSGTGGTNLGQNLCAPNICP